MVSLEALDAFVIMTNAASRVRYVRVRVLLHRLGTAVCAAAVMRVSCVYYTAAVLIAMYLARSDTALQASGTYDRNT